jgi:tripartite ATP-independent transporter DctP family solute receptor
MKKILSLLLMVMIVAGTLAACGGESSSGGGESSSGNGGSDSGSDSSNSSSESEFPEMTLALGHATSDSENSHYQQFSEKFKEEVEKATDGKVTIEIHPNAELGGEREMIEAVQFGTLDMLFTSSGPVGNFASKSNAFDFPFLFRDKEHAYKVLDGELGDEVAAQLEGVGIKLLAWGENGFRNITNSRNPIIKPEDLEGIVIRTMENKVHLASFQAFGAEPTPMSFAELFTALQQKVVDAQENPLSVIVPNKFYEVQKYLTLSGHFYSPAPFLMSLDKFNSFSPELQKIIQDASIVARDYERDFIAKKNDEYIQTAKDNGMEIVTREEYDYEAFLEAAQPVYKQYEAEYGEYHKKIQAVK